MAQPGGKNGSGEEERELHTTFYSDSAYRKYQKKICMNVEMWTAKQ